MRASSKLARYNATDSNTASAIVDRRTSYSEIVTRPMVIAAASSTLIVGSRRSRMLRAAIDHAAHEINLAQLRWRTNCEARWIATHAASSVTPVRSNAFGC